MLRHLKIRFERWIILVLRHCRTWTHTKSYTPFTRYNRLSNGLYNRFDNRLYRVNEHPTGCQTGCQTVDNRFDNRVERTATVRSTGFQRLYTRYSRLLHGFDNPLNVCIHDTTGCNRLYCVNGALQSVIWCLTSRPDSPDGDTKPSSDGKFHPQIPST